MDVVIALSGGVDSAVCAHLLREQGHRLVAGVTMTLDRGNVPGPGSPEDLEAAAQLCQSLGIAHFVFPVGEVYRAAVIEVCRSAYRAGLTPNACVLCNPAVKLGALPRLAREAGLHFDAFATGHYARLAPAERGGDAVRDEGVEGAPAASGIPALAPKVLLRGRDSVRDQAYFLYRISAAQRDSLLFPLGGYTKTEIREIAKALSLPVAHKPDSQDLCIAREELLGDDELPGEIVSVDGTLLGTHKGFWRATIGQRKGVGVSGTGIPLYVTELDPRKNRIIMGGKDALKRERFRVEACVWTSLERPPETGTQFRCSAKLRSAGEPQGGVTVTLEEGNCARVTCENGFLAVTPGQSAVFYHGDIVLGGGLICRD